MLQHRCEERYTAARLDVITLLLPQQALATVKLLNISLSGMAVAKPPMDFRASWIYVRYALADESEASVPALIVYRTQRCMGLMLNLSDAVMQRQHRELLERCRGHCRQLQQACADP